MGRRWSRAFPAAVLAAVAAGCGNGGGGKTAATPTSTVVPTTVPAATTSTTVPLAAYRTFGTPKTLASAAGYVVAASVDGTAIDVRRPDPSRQVPDCAGQRPADALYRVSLTGGADELVMAGAEPVVGDVIRGPGGKVAVFKQWASDGCPGFEARISVGTELPDGRFRDLKRVTGTGTTLDTLSSLAWSTDGGRLVSFQSGSKRPGDPWPVVAIDPSTGAVTKLFDVGGPITAVATLANGSYAVSHDGTVTVHDSAGAVQQTVTGSLASVSPDRTSLVVGPTGTAGPVVLITAGQPTPTPLFTVEAKSSLARVNFSPDGRAVAYSVNVGASGTRLSVATLADHQSADSPTAGFSPVFIGTGRALVFTTTASSTGGALTVLPLGT